MPVHEIEAVADASWSLATGGRATTGCTVWLGDMLLTAWSRTQTCIALSTCEAEILALNAVADDVVLAVSLLTELEWTSTAPTLSVKTDSSSAIATLKKKRAREDETHSTAGIVVAGGSC